MEREKIAVGEFASVTVSGKNHGGNARLPNCCGFRFAKPRRCPVSVERKEICDQYGRVDYLSFKL